MISVYLELSPQCLRQIAALVASLCMYSALPSDVRTSPNLFHVGSTSAKAVCQFPGLAIVHVGAPPLLMLLRACG